MRRRLRTARPSLGQDELVLSSEAEPIQVAAVADDDLPRSHEQITAVDSSVDDPNVSSSRYGCSRRIARISRLFFVGGTVHLAVEPKYSSVFFRSLGSLEAL